MSLPSDIKPRHRVRLALLVLAAALAGTVGEASASELLDRNASHTSLTVNSGGQAFVSWRASGRTRQVIASGAINARAPPSRGTAGLIQPQVRRQEHPVRWLPALRRTAARLARAGLQGTRRLLLGAPELAANEAELRWSSRHLGSPALALERPASAARGVDRLVLRRYDHLYGRLTYGGSPVFGFRTSSQGNPLDAYGRNVYVDTYNSRYGGGWHRENGFVAQRPTGVFCYGFYPHGSRPAGNGTHYRATVIGPGVTPDVMWQGPAPDRSTGPGSSRRTRTSARSSRRRPRRLPTPLEAPLHRLTTCR